MKWFCKVIYCSLNMLCQIKHIRKTEMLVGGSMDYCSILIVYRMSRC